jgi:lipopolysaccharide export system protein LptA
VRFTIERLRNLVLAAGVFLVCALLAFLAVGKWKNPLNLKELPKRLGVDIQQEANGYTLSHAFGAHSQYKIHASKVFQLKDNRAILHDVKIELYDTEGGRVDRIEGKEFEYDQQLGKATAAGPVEITLMRPGVAPAIAPKAAASKALNGMAKDKPLSAVVETASTGEIHVETSGLTFDTKSGMAATSEPVNFSMAQAAGSSIGATYDSQQGQLVLDHAVQLNTLRDGDAVQIRAQHAEFDRTSYLCRLHVATADYRGGREAAGDAKILFREDGTAVRLDATNGFTMNTASGGSIAAPTGSLDFNEHNQPRHGHLEGGVTMDSASTRAGQNGLETRKEHGTSPTAELEFTAQGQLRRAHLERGVEMHSEDVSEQVKADSKRPPLRVSRTWRSPLADVEFRDAGHGQVEPARLSGSQGVVVTSESQRGDATVVPSRLAADSVIGDFDPGSVLRSFAGIGHAGISQTTHSGTLQTASGDRLDMQFVPVSSSGSIRPSPSKIVVGGGKAPAMEDTAQIQSAVLDGHVVLVEQPSAKPGADAAVPMRATAGHAVYEGSGEWLRLTLNPRVDDGGLQLTADKIDVSQDSGDAFAHGNVKATWTGNANSAATANSANGPGNAALGGKGPAHIVSTDAQLHQATGLATFRGHARLWQQASSVAGPVIVLDRGRQTLVAQSSDPLEPVRAVLVSVESAAHAAQPNGNPPTGRSETPSVIRVRGGDLKYSDAEHKAVMHSGTIGPVAAETATASSISDQVELVLLPPGNHAGKDGAAAQVDTLTARGHVTVSSDGRRGTGEQLVYSGETGEYVLTGTASLPPRMTDPVRGTVTGEALIFHSRDDSVSVEGGGRETITETTAPR